LLRLAAFLLFVLPFTATADERDITPQFETALAELTQSSFKKKTEAVGALTDIKDKRVLPVLNAMLEGLLYYRKSDKRIVYAEETTEGYAITDVLSGENLGVVGNREIKKVSTNNSLRRYLRNAIAELSLTSPDPQVRLNAVNQMIGGISPETAEILRKLRFTEPDPDVRKAINEAIAMVDINAGDKAVRLAALDILAESLRPEARNALAPLVAKNAAGEWIEADGDVRRQAQRALHRIDERLEFFGFLETTFFGLSLGSVLLLIAVGLAITFGVMGVINMAHGELMMLGAYTTYVIQQLMPNYIDVSVLVAIPAAFIVAGLVGIAIERGVIRFLYGRPLETLLATFGISLVLQQLVRSIFSPLNRAVETPSWMSGSLEINNALSLTYNRLYIIAFALLVFMALLLVLKKTSLGLQVRAVSQNRTMARAMGIRTEWVDALTFGLGSGIAGVAGVALSQLTNVGPNLGQAYIVDSFMVVVFGGVGNLWGTLVGAFTLGVGNKFLEPWVGAVLAKILVLVFIILFIQKRPRGLFPQKGRAAEGG
jgi:urea transport system permease protein